MQLSSILVILLANTWFLAANRQPQSFGLTWIMHKGRLWRTDPDEPYVECVNDFFGKGISLVLTDSQGQQSKNGLESNSTGNIDVEPIDTPERTLRAMRNLKEMIPGAHINIPGSNFTDEMLPIQQERYRELKLSMELLELAENPRRRQVRRNLKFYISPPIHRMVNGLSENLRGGTENFKHLEGEPSDSPVSITLRGFVPVCDVRTMNPSRNAEYATNRFVPNFPAASMEISTGRTNFVGHYWKEESTDNKAKSKTSTHHNVLFSSNSSHGMKESENLIEPMWWDEEGESSESLSATAQQILDFRSSAAGTLRTEITTQQQSATIPRDSNPFLGSSSEHSDSESGSVSGPADVFEIEKPADRFTVSENVVSAFSTINDLLKKERLRFLTQGPIAIDNVIQDPQHNLDMQLWQAARAGSPGNVTLAIRSGARVTSGDDGFHGWTALHRAADKGCADVVRVLLHFGAAVDTAEAARGLTPLHLAVHQGRVEVARLLLAAGADATMPDAGGVRAVDLAQLKATTSSRHEQMLVCARSLGFGSR